MTEHVQVQFTVDDRAVADIIATELLERRLAACVQVLGPVTSRYRWEGALETSEEWLALVKTTAGRADVVVEAIRARHPYDVPEVLVTPVTGLPGYLAWIDDSVS
jgi:periplasmic divalent cation tolerance protein